MYFPKFTVKQLSNIPVQPNVFTSHISKESLRDYNDIFWV